MSEDSAPIPHSPQENPDREAARLQYLTDALSSGAQVVFGPEHIEAGRDEMNAGLRERAIRERAERPPATLEDYNTAAQDLQVLFGTPGLITERLRQQRTLSAGGPVVIPLATKKRPGGNRDSYIIHEDGGLYKVQRGPNGPILTPMGDMSTTAPYAGVINAMESCENVDPRDAVARVTSKLDNVNATHEAVRRSKG